MNLILVEESELVNGEVLLAIVDERTKHVKKILKLKNGDSLKVGVVNGSIFRSTIQWEEEVLRIILVEEIEKNEQEAGVDLILACPRPKVTNRLWPVIASLGVRRIFIVNANKVEKGYFESRNLKDKRKWRKGLIEGLQQCAVDTLLPEIHIKRRLKTFLEDEVPKLFENQIKLFCHPGAYPRISQLNLSEYCSNFNGSVLAIGPEGGWTEFEVNLFTQCNFIPVSLGNRILRTDVALISLITLLKDKLFRFYESNQKQPRIAISNEESITENETTLGLPKKRARLSEEN